MKKPLSTCIAILAVLAPAAAQAHPGHGLGGGLAAGFLHPLTGLDHFAAMALAGVWAGMMRGPLVRTLPFAFCAAMLAGFACAPWLGTGLAEALVAASVFALAGATVLRLCPPLPIAVVALALFGFGHGLAHGLELPTGAAPTRFVAGFILASAMLQLAGFAAARWAGRRTRGLARAGTR